MALEGGRDPLAGARGLTKGAWPQKPNLVYHNIISILYNIPTVLREP